MSKEPKNFWQTLPWPIMMLAPMADVTDASFRRIIAKYGKPDVMWTEFVSADGIVLADPIGKAKLMKDLIYTEAERPIVAQFFTANPEHMKKAAALAKELGFDGVDINMGCPDRSIERQGAGAAMIKNPKLAREIIRAAKEGAKSDFPELGGIPVSVKTRVGFNKSELETWLPELLSEEPAAITVHARTRKEMSKVPARWEEVKRAVEIRDEFFAKKYTQNINGTNSNSTNTKGANIGGANKGDSDVFKTLIFGNGDALNIEDAKKKAKETGADGVMLGRAIFGNPWLFSAPSRAGSAGELPAEISPNEKLHVLIEHTKLFEELLGGQSGKNFAIMKKHFKAYVNGWNGAKELRMKLMEAKNAEEVEEIIKAENH